MANLSYIESLNRKRHSFSLFQWVKQNPKKRISEIYKDKVPLALLKRADRFQKWFKTYPGDGVLYFHDDLLSPLSEVFPKDSFSDHPKEYNLFFNYLYSFKSNFTINSRGALTVFLLDCPYLAVPLYNYRKNFDSEAFTDLIDKMSAYRSFNDYLDGDNARRITQFMWNAILTHEVPLTICDNHLFMHLYYAYTHKAIQRFFFLSNSRAALKEHINSAYNIYRETCLLLDCWQKNVTRLYLNPNRIIPQMSSIKAMERFHDLKTEEILAEQRMFETAQHTWDTLSAKIQEVSPEWYLPEYTSDIRIRGQQHHNCVGAYVERHFQSIENNFKMLLLFTDFCEAEVHVFFGEVIEEGKAFLGCIDVTIQQAKTAYNKNISPGDLSELKKIVKIFKHMPAEDFNPVVKDLT